MSLSMVSPTLSNGLNNFIGCSSEAAQLPIINIGSFLSAPVCIEMLFNNYHLNILHHLTSLHQAQQTICDTHALYCFPLLVTM